MSANWNAHFASSTKNRRYSRKVGEGCYISKSIGRRPARVFISNAAKSNALGRRLAEELRLRNIYGFQYKEPNAILPGSDWKQKIRSEIETCDIFLAIIGEGYKASKWCMEEMRAASARSPHIELLPYQVDDADVGFMDKVHVAQLPSGLDEPVQFMLDRIHTVLTDRRGRNVPVTHTTMLGGSRVAIIDTIRHIPKSEWPTLMDRMRESGIAISAADPGSGPLWSRQVAEKLLWTRNRSIPIPIMKQHGHARAGANESPLRPHTRNSCEAWPCAPPK